MMERIYTYSIVWASSAEFQDRVPYVAAILERDDHTRFPAFVHGYEPGRSIEIGMPVHRRENGEETLYTL